MRMRRLLARVKQRAAGKRFSHAVSMKTSITFCASIDVAADTRVAMRSASARLMLTLRPTDHRISISTNPASRGFESSG